MATEGKDLSSYDPSNIPNANGLRLGVVVSEWNSEITNGLLEGALKTFQVNGVQEQDIFVRWVPGSFELAFAAQFLIEKYDLDAVVCLGSVIQGETRHFEFVCNATAKGIMNVGINTGKPVIFGVLTDDNIDQAKDRSGGKHGNKGVECAIAAIKMALLD